MDIDKNRADYVTRLEVQLQAIQRELAEAKAAAKWEPKTGLDMTATGARITLSMDGRNATVSVATDSLIRESGSTLTTEVLAALITEVVEPVLRPVIQAEVDRAVSNARATNGAGKW